MLRLTVAAALSLALAACSGDDPPPLFIDMQWQVQCDIARGCTGIPARDVFGGNGQDGVNMTCTISETVENNQVINFSARRGNEFGLQIQNATVPAGGGPLLGSACRATIWESDNTYSGACGAGAPTGGCIEDPRTSGGAVCNQPCRLYDLTITSLADGLVDALFYCQGLPLTADRTVVREITNPDPAADGASAASFPVTIKLEGCTQVGGE